MGLIPAHAGKTMLGEAKVVDWEAHPRSRGENRRRREYLASHAGSSPLTRGKRAISQISSEHTGLIPAHAGKTSPDRKSHHGSRAHPRSRGENSSDATPAKDSVGSSPLTRGKPLVGWCPTRRTGLIPAHAGKTMSVSFHCGERGAHPRSRGENIARARAIAQAKGSSPLTRGKRWGRARAPGWRGLIPAHAGKTVFGDAARCWVGAHPRSRGENGMGAPMMEALPGSSPLTRGKRFEGGTVDRRAGLIPAHAGKTLRVSSAGASAAGSSPLTRGKQSV